MLQSILHLKLRDNDKLDYFPTSTPSKHNPHRHGLLQALGWFDGEILTSSLH
jgi:hypothetical protein